MTQAVPDFHRELYGLAYSDNQFTAVVAPRFFAKSTVFSFAYPLYLICQSKISRVVIISDTLDLAKDWLRKVTFELENNQALIADYGNMKGAIWNQDQIICNRADGTQIEIRARGAGCQIRGFHPEIVIIDDLENDNDVLSETLRKKLEDWFFSAVINTLEEEGSRLVMIGTILHPLSLLKSLIGREGWVTRFYECYDSTGNSIWPEKWSNELLANRRRIIGSRRFNQEFRNQPMVNENPIFDRNHFKTYDTDSAEFQKLLKQGMYTVIAIDPAIGRLESNDYTAITTTSACFGEVGRIYLRKKGVLRGRWPLHRTVIEAMRLYKEFNANAIVIETVSYQQALADEFRRHMDDENCVAHIVEVKPDKIKERRAHAVVPILERGCVYVDPSDTNHELMVDECVLFPTGSHDDWVDSFVYNLTQQQTRRNSASGRVQIVSSLDKAGW